MRPEQDKTLEYLHTKGTCLAPREIEARVRAAFEATEEFLGRTEEAEARRRPGPEEWCAQEVVDHLVETHRPSLDELRCLLRGERPLGGPIPAHLQSRAPLDRPWGALIAELTRLHAEILSVLASIPEDLATTAARAPLILVVNARTAEGGSERIEWVEELDWKAYAVVFRLHEIEHLRQARHAAGAR